MVILKESQEIISDEVDDRLTDHDSGLIQVVTYQKGGGHFQEGIVDAYIDARPSLDRQGAIVRR